MFCWTNGEKENIHTVFVSIKNLANFRDTLRDFVDISLQKLKVDMTRLNFGGINLLRSSL